MKQSFLTLVFFALGFTAMLLIDRSLGTEAEFLNLWNLLSKIFNGDTGHVSLIESYVGTWGALGVAIVVLFITANLFARLGTLLIGKFSLPVVAIIVALSTAATPTQAQTGVPGTYQIGLTFGEIPILAGSFKPGIQLGYHWNEHVYTGVTFQLPDNLSRGDESFNAVNTGFDGLLSSDERTGSRFLLQARITPVYRGPYISLGMVWNGNDRETSVFQSNNHAIEGNEYDGTITLVQTRRSGFRPAIGIGYQYDFENGLSIYTDFTMDFFTGVPTPEVEIATAGFDLPGSVQNNIRSMVQETYRGNQHNRYHMFNLGISYRLDSSEE